MNRILVCYNMQCINCQAIEKEMRRVGAVFFCPSCCDKIFETDDPVIKEREKYLKFLHLQMEAEEARYEIH